MKKFVDMKDLLIIPRRFSGAEIDEKTNVDLAGIAKEFTDNFEKYLGMGEAPSFFGSPGIGKTHVAAVIARDLSEKGIPCFWVDVVGQLNKLMDLRDFRDKEYFNLKKTISRVPFAVLDDFGHLQKYERTRELFFELVNSRYSSKLPTLFTANYIVGQEANSWTEIEKAFGAALVRRIRLMSNGLLFSS